MKTMSKYQSFSGFTTWFTALLLSALVAGCGGGGGGQDPILGTGGGAVITGTAPTVTSVTPVPNATSVPTNTRIITATFTKAMDPASLTPATFTLACPAGTAQSGTVAYVTSGSVATWTMALAANLPANTTCTATITTGTKDTTGIPLAANFTWTFTTGAAPDTTAPTVTGTINANGATNVAINTKVGATFSEVMDPATISATTFTLMQGATAVAGTVTYAGINAVFTPASNLAPNTTYTVTVTTGAKDVRGNALANNFVISWTTGVAPDTTAPTVTGTVNAQAALDVPINTKVGATFSEAMDPLTITTANFTFVESISGDVVAGVVNYSGVSVVFTPLKDLTPATPYSATIKGGANGVKDLAGNPMVADFGWSWATGALADTTAPTVTGTINANGATNVAINTNVGATFSEGMNPLTITNLNFALKETVSGTAVTGVVSYAGVSAVFNPVNNLAANTGYTVTVKGGASGVKDLAGNPMASDFTISWTTGAAPDTTAPTVTGTINANGATNVAINTNVGATFSEGMNPLTITNLNFALKETVSGTAVTGVVSYAGVSAVFNPVSNLVPNTGYTLTVKGGVSGVKDLAGNPMASDFTISWTTGAALDTTAPAVISTINANGATNVAINTNVGATFTEGMNPLTITNVNFAMKQTVSGTAVVGVVSYSGVSAVFNPVNSLAPNTGYTLTVKGGASGVKDLAGNPMASDFVWSWTTGAAPDTTAPTVTFTSPVDLEAGVAVNKAPYVLFSESMDPLTINTSSFTITGPGGAPVAGTVGNPSPLNSSIFSTSIGLANNTTYTGTITTAAKDLAGNALAANKVWTFTTGGTTPPPGPSCALNPRLPVNLGLAGNFVALAKSGITTTGVTTITGDIGVSPIDSTAVTGFGLIMDVSNQFATSSFVTGKVYAADYTAPTPGNMTTTISNMETAYTDAAGRPIPDATELGAGNITGQTLTAGLYKWSTGVSIDAAGAVTLSGCSTDIWILQIAGDLLLNSGARITLAGAAQAKNVYWQVGGGTGVTLETTSAFQGNILAAKAITFKNGATLNGRALAQTNVTLIGNTITAP